MSSNNAWSLLEDNEGNIWIGTQGGGVCQYSGELFETYTINEGLVGNNIFSIFEDSKKNYWLGTENLGVSVFKYNTNSHLLEHDFNLTKDNGLANNRIRSIVEDNEGNIWIGTWGKGINVYNPQTKKIKTYDHENGLSSKFISNMVKDKNGNIYISNTNNLDVFYAKEKRFQAFEVEGEKVNKFVRSVLLDDDNIWIATNGSGLMRFDGDQLIAYTKENSIISSQVAIYCLTKDNMGNIWVGTGGDGIYKYDGENFEHYTTDNGLGSDEIYILTADNNDNIWVGTAVGLNKNRRKIQGY